MVSWNQNAPLNFMNSPTHPPVLSEATLCPSCGGQVSRGQRLCPACLITTFATREAEDFKEEARERDLAALQRSWALLKCPPEYCATQWSKIDQHPLLSPACATLAKHFWVGDAQHGLAMHGASGTGKTRAAWDILRRHHFARRWTCAFVKSFDFAHWARTAERGRGSDRTEAFRSIDRAKKVDLLVFDDLGTESYDQTVAGFVWDLFEVRTSQRRPIIVTTEHDGKSLTEKFLPTAKGDANRIIRRIREFCQDANVNLPQALP